MIDAGQFIQILRIDPERLQVLIDRGWIIPVFEGSRPVFGEVDIARAAFVADLVNDMGVNDNGVDVVLELLDQLHGLRTACTKLIDALEAERRQNRYRAATRPRTALKPRLGAAHRSG